MLGNVGRCAGALFAVCAGYAKVVRATPKESAKVDAMKCEQRLREFAKSHGMGSSFYDLYLCLEDPVCRACIQVVYQKCILGEGETNKQISEASSADRLEVDFGKHNTTRRLGAGCPRKL